jgi:undecaprenyl-diphosphatase
VEWWQAVILGIVEGITEYLPVSSTGHLIIATELMRFDEKVRPHVDAFNIVIQGGAILAVVGLYFPRILQMLRGLVGRDEAGRKLLINLFIAFLPAAIIGVLLDSTISKYLFSTWPVLAALLAGAIWMIWLDRWRARKIAEDTDRGVPEEQSRFCMEIDDLTWKHALGIGFLQCLAMWPGTSRSMMTIAGGTLIGLKPKAAAEFSFLLGLPTLGGACVYKLGRNLQESARTGEDNMFEALGTTPLLIGLIVATVSAAFAIKWLVAFLTKHGLSAFGWYRIALCIVLGSLVAAGIVQVG